MGGRICGRVDVRAYGWINGCCYGRNGVSHSGRHDRWTVGATDGSMCGRTGRWSAGHVCVWLCVAMGGRADHSCVGPVCRSNDRSPARSTDLRAELRTVVSLERRSEGRAFGRTSLRRGGTRKRWNGGSAERSNARSTDASLGGPVFGWIKPSVERWFARRADRWANERSGAATRGSAGGPRGARPCGAYDGTAALCTAGSVAGSRERTYGGLLDERLDGRVDVRPGHRLHRAVSGRSLERAGGWMDRRGREDGRSGRRPIGCSPCRPPASRRCAEGLTGSESNIRPPRSSIRGRNLG